MAVDPLFEGIVSIQVQDNDAPGRLGAIIAQLQSKMAELGNLPGVQLGQQMFGSVEAGAKGTLTVLDQLKVALGEMNAASRGMLASGAAGDSPQIAQMREMVVGTEAVIVKLRELMVVQQEQQLTSVKGAAIAAAVPVVPALTGDQQLAARGLQFQGGQVVPIPSVGVSGSGLGGEAAARAAAAEVTGTATALSKAQADNAAADIGVAKATQNLEKSEIDAEVRIQGLLKAWSTSMGAQLRLEKAMGTEAAALEKAAAATPVVANLSGINTGASARVQQLQLDLAINVAKEQTLAAAGKGAVTEVELAQARIRTLAVEERLTAAMERQAAEASGTGSGGGGFGGMGGLTMLKYYAFYQVFQMGQTALTAVKTATEQYSLAVNQLSIALGVSFDQAGKTAQAYAQIGASLATPPAVAVTSATQYTRFFQDTSGAAGSIGATLGSTINLLEGRNAQQGQEEAMVTKALDEVGAIAHNYNLGASGASDLYSSATLIAQHYGQGGGSKITTGTAQIADLLKQAGFTPEQGLGVVAQVAQATGATSDLAAGDLKRLLGRSGSNTFQSLFGEYGINPNQSTSKELGQLSLKFQDLTPTQQDSVITKLGGGRSGAAALAMIVDLPSIMAEAAKAKADPTAAQDQAQLKLAAFGGQVEQIKTDLLSLATDLGQAGLGGALGLLLKGVDPLVRGLDDMVKGFNALGPVVNTGVIGLGGLAVAVRVLGGSLDAAGVEAATSKLGALAKFSPEGPLSFLAPAVVAPVATAGEMRVAVSTNAATEALAAQTAAEERLAVASREAALSGVATADAAAAMVAAEAEVATARKASASAALLQVDAERTLAVANQEVAVTAATTATAETEMATAGLGEAIGGLAVTAGAAALAMAPLVAIIGAIMLVGAVKAKIDEAAAGRAEGTAAGTAGADAMRTGNIPLARSAANLDMAGALKSLDSNSGWIGDLKLGLGSINDLVHGHGWDTAAKAQIATIQSMIDAHKKLTDWIATATAAENKMTAATPSSQLWGPGYANINTGVITMAANQMGVQASSQKMQDLIANTTAGTVAGDLSVTQQFNPASGDKGLEAEVKRDIALAQKALSPLDQQAQLNSLLPLVALLKAEAAKVGDPAQRAGALDSAGAIGDQIVSATMTSLLKVTNDRIASIKALNSESTQSVAQIRALLTSSVTEAAQQGDANTVVALFAEGDKAFMDNAIRESQARLKVIQGQVATDLAADKAAVALATLESGGQSTPAPVMVFNPAQIAITDKKKKTLQDQIDALNKQEVANKSRDAQLRSFQVDPSGPDANAQWLATVQANIETEKAILFKQMSAIDQANINLANEQAILAGMGPAPAGSTATAGPAGAAADFGTAPAPTTSKDPKVIAATKKYNDDLAKQKAAQTQLATESAAAGISAPTGSAFKWTAATGPTAAQIEEARLAAQAIPGDPMSAALTNLRVAQYKMSEPKNQVEYWQAVKALHDAQYAYSQAQEAGANAQLSASATPGDPISAATVALQVAQNQLANAVGTTAYYTALKGVHDAQYALAQAQMAAANAQISAQAISGDPLSAAAAALQVAQNVLSQAVGSTAYWTAVKGLSDAQVAYAQAQGAYVNDLANLRIDMTNPLAVAREKVIEAANQLNYDRGRGATSATAKDQVAYQQAKSAADKAAFDQQFSDQSTNYNLQRESLSAYLSYLNAQHNYLTAVHSKTRQQVDELNQVDQALKGLADQMQGQFNLGAIKVPTVYEARAGTGLSTTNNVTITINGTDIPAVTALLTTYVGQGAMSTSGSTARKV